MDAGGARRSGSAMGRNSAYTGKRPVPKTDGSPPIPSVNERLAFLRPSRELLEYYRKKIAEFDEEHEALLKRLESYKATYEEQHKLQWEMRQREEEIEELQKALSDMQVYLFQEREHALRLYAENDRLKIRELEDRKKMQHLLALVGPEAETVTYFHREPPHKVTVPQRTVQHGHTEVTSSKKGLKKVPSKVTRAVSPTIPDNYQRDNQTLLLQVEALQSQLQEQTQLAKEQTDALLEDRRIRMEEAHVQHERDKDKIKSLAEKLHKTQNLLYESTKDFLQLKFEGRDAEKVWMAEKDRLLQELDRHNELRNGGGDSEMQFHRESPMEHEIQRIQSEEIKSLEEQVNQAHRLADMYREQCVTLENDLARIREEGDVGRQLFKERSDKTVKRLQLMTQRYEALEKRRGMEVEGFKNDIKLLRQRLKDVERQLFKVTLGIGPDQDLAILHEVRRTVSQSRQIQGELKNLKAKIYGLESQLRFG
ncbi:coiled-coil domain-containing protein 77 isoform X2 [Chiloscyllium plagiosum]|uniref:coiled-coil domain-containing protein 77 isoform X2 n=1 Tax=Chiloscyllium plagiosum TaxID=36176 RepID=UPI001CB85DD9|nr:coiled-coil domain-containing protein 77 isoform X2 [Chiloscyllium plagiosum]